jgi:hypothetical protein
MKKYLIAALLALTLAGGVAAVSTMTAKPAHADGCGNNGC